MQKITPHLWYDKEAVEAAEFYVSIFGNSKIKNINSLEGTPSGKVDIVSFELYGQNFMSIGAGPYFKFNSSVSFMVSCKSVEEIEKLWNKLIDGGRALMEIGSHPFSQKYGWLEDKYGLSWQIIYMGDIEAKQKISPSFLFVGEICGKAEEAMKFYTTVFHNSRIETISYYEEKGNPKLEKLINYAAFEIENYCLVAMDSGLEHSFKFNEAISFMVNCSTQAEIDYYWEKLSAVPEAEQCGWLKDKYGLSWQITPALMNEMMSKGTKEQIARVTEAFLKMKKFDIATLQTAYDNKT